MKRTLYLVLTFVLLTTLFSVSALAAENDFVTAKYTYISANGIETEGLEIISYNGNNPDIYIPSTIGKVPVLKIGDDFLKDNTGVNSVTLGAGIKEIGEGAFSGAENMVCALLNEDIEVIGAEAFSFMPVFNSVILWDGIKSIGDGAFLNCPKLTVYCNRNTVSYIYVENNCINYSILNPDAQPEIITENGLTYYINGGKAELMTVDLSLVNVVVPASVNNYPVTSINSAFENLTNVRNVTLQCKITEIGYREFSGCSSLTSIVLPDGLKTIDRYAFSSCSSLQSINIPDSVTTIGAYCFYNCSSLRSIILPDSVTSVGSDLFHNCTSLTSVKLSNNLKSLSSYMFSSCKSLKSIEIPDGITSIASSAFRSCQKLYDIKLPANLKTIGRDAFMDCNAFVDIVIPDTVTSISNNSFYGCERLKSITLPEGITNIPQGAFMYCYQLTTVNLPETIKTIENEAFKGCYQLNSITIPKNTEIIGSSAFYNCFNLQSVNLPENLLTISGSAFANCSGLNNIDLPEGLLTISGNAFYECSEIQTIIIPSTVTTISSNSFPSSTMWIVYEGTVAQTVAQDNEIQYISAEIGKKPELHVYYGITYFIRNGEAIVVACDTSLESVTVLDSVNNRPVTTIYTAFYEHDNLVSVTLPDTIKYIEKNAFYSCSKLENINMPKNLVYIKDFAFYGCKMKKLDFSEGLESIGTSAFCYCSQLTEVNLPKTLKTIGSQAFEYCPQLFYIKIPENVSQIISDSFSYNTVWVVFEDTYAHNYIKKTKRLHYVIKYDDEKIPVYIINDIAYFIENNEAVAIGNVGGLTSAVIASEVEGYPVTRMRATFYKHSVKSVTLPSTLKQIEPYTFYGCSMMRNIDLPAGLEYIGDYAFYDCTWLSSIVVPEGVTTIGSNAFYNCNLYNGIILPSTLKTIGQYAFYSNNFKTIIIPEGVEEIGYSAFKLCRDLENIQLPSSLKTIGGNVFYDCESLKELNVPEGVKTFPSYAVYQCDALESITFPTTLEKIDYTNFSGCTNLKRINIKDLEKWLQVVTDDENVLWERDLYLNGELLTDLVIPESITTIGEDKFRGCLSLKSVTMHNGVTSMEYGAFSCCVNLEKVTLSQSLTELPPCAFVSCEKLEYISLPNGITEIKYSAFSNCKSLLMLYVPKRVNKIQSGEFVSSTTILLVEENSFIHQYAKKNQLKHFVLHETKNPDVSHGMAITGTVRYSDGSAVADADIALLYDNGTEYEIVKSDSNGNYIFTYAQVGTYSIKVKDKYNNSAFEQVSVKRKNVFDVILTGETDLVLKKGYNINVTVNGKLPVSISLSDMNGISVPTLSSDTGNVTFENIAPGDYIVKAENNEGSSVAEITVFKEDVDVSLTIAGKYVTLRGKVVVKDRENEEHDRGWAQVYVYNEYGFISASGKTDENGTYCFEKLPIGEYTVKAEVTEMREDEYYGYIRPHVLKGYTYVNAPEAAIYDVETIVLTEEESEKVTISGKVTAQGEHQACRVILMNENRDELASFTTKKNGKYQFDNIKNGYYIIFAITENDGAGFAEITVKDGKIYGETDIRVYKSDRIAYHEAALSAVPDCATSTEAEEYREAVMAEKAFYDSIPDKEKKMFSEWYIEKLDRLVKLLSGYEYTCDGAEIENGGLIVSEEDVLNGTNPHFIVKIVETSKWEKTQSGIETDEDYYQTLIEEAAGDNELAQYYDITLECEKNGKTYEITDIKKHTDTTGKIRLTMPIPDQYRGHENYSFVHVHNGQTTVLVDLDDNPETITFEIDKFSTFALMFNDEETPDLLDYATLSVNDGVLTAVSTADATLYIANYDSVSRRMTGVTMTPVYADTPIEVNVVSGQKIFVLDSDMSPLCEEIIVA